MIPLFCCAILRDSWMLIALHGVLGAESLTTPSFTLETRLNLRNLQIRK